MIRLNHETLDNTEMCCRGLLYFVKSFLYGKILSIIIYYMGEFKKWQI